MENLNTEKEVREALERLDRKRKSIILRSFLMVLIPIGVVVFIVWYSSTIIKENYVLKADNIDLEATSAKRAQTIERITDNYFEVTGELNSKLDSLTATNAEQTQTIKQITDHFFKITGKLNEEVSSLRATRDQQATTNAEQAQTIKQITDNYFKVTGELNDEIVSLRDENAALRKELQKLRR